MAIPADELRTQLEQMIIDRNDLVRRLQSLEAAMTSVGGGSNSPPTAPPHARDSERLIDTRLMQKPSTFAGDRASWSDWSFTVKAYVGAVSSRMRFLMQAAQGEENTVGLPEDPEDQRANNQLYFVLAMLVKDMAMKRVRSAPEGHGAEAWRLLCEEYEPRRPKRFQVMLSSILRPVLKDPLGSSLDDFERQVKQYQDQSGKEVPSPRRRADQWY